jgi:hypothetical protein
VGQIGSFENLADRSGNRCHVPVLTPESRSTARQRLQSLTRGTGPIRQPALSAVAAS